MAQLEPRERILTIRLLERMESSPEFTRRLGLSLPREPKHGGRRDEKGTNRPHTGAAE